MKFADLRNLLYDHHPLAYEPEDIFFKIAVLCGIDSSGRRRIPREWGLALFHM
jgi:hypothetical protein